MIVIQNHVCKTSVEEVSVHASIMMMMFCSSLDLLYQISALSCFLMDTNGNNYQFCLRKQQLQVNYIYECQINIETYLF